MRSRDFHLFKANVKDALLDFLYGPAEAEFDRGIAELVIADALARGDGVRMFRFKGRNFSITGERPNAKYYPRLSRAYEPSALALLAEFDPILIDERDKVSAFISQIMNRSDNPLDYLQWFPSALRTPLKRVYEHFKMPIDGVDFNGNCPPGLDEEVYNLMGARVGLNLLLG